MHSHHSHSGDYISHAEGTLDEMVATAKRRGFSHFCLTEHMPRLSDNYLYPEEIEKKYTTAHLSENFRRYLSHAQEIQKRENEEGTIKILTGFEVEGIDNRHIDAAKCYLKETDMCVGSVHYVNHIPIDFNRELWIKARDSLGGLARNLYKAYFELQFNVITNLKPMVIGHFDLIRLFDPQEVDPTTGKSFDDLSIEIDWPDVWDLIQRNIKYVNEYGGLFEINAASIRKGWTTPYPQVDISQAIIDLGGKFCFSDDSHAYAQIGLNFHKAWDYVLNTLKLDHIYHLDLLEDGTVTVVADSVAKLSKLSFWKQYN